MRIDFQILGVTHQMRYSRPLSTEKLLQDTGFQIMVLKMKTNPIR